MFLQVTGANHQRPIPIEKSFVATCGERERERERESNMFQLKSCDARNIKYVVKYCSMSIKIIVKKLIMIIL